MNIRIENLNESHYQQIMEYLAKIFERMDLKCITFYEDDTIFEMRGKDEDKPSV